MAYSGDYPVYLSGYNPLQFSVGAYFQQDPVENKSKADWLDMDIYFNDSSQRYKTFILNGSFNVAGTAISFSNEEYETSYRDRISWGGYVSPIVISHDSSGKANVTMAIDLTITRKDDPSITFRIQANETTALHQIDRVAPVVSASVNILSDSSIKISASSNETCKDWEYKLDSLVWVNFETESVTAAECTVTALSAARHTVQVRAKRVYNEVVGTSSTVSFETTLPTVTARLSNPTYNSLDLSATATATCDLWEYSLDNGSNWTTFSTTSGTSASTTLTSLQPNTTYSVLVRARKVSNGLKGVSSAATGTTNGGSILTRANNSALDVGSPSISFVVTVRETLYHKLKIYKKNGTTLVKTITVGTLEVGTGQTVTKAISSTVKNALLNCFPSAKTYDFKITLESFSDSGYQTSLGESGPVVWKGTTSEANSKPTFTTFVYCDTETETVDATGDDQVLIQVASHLLVTATAGTAKNGASISGYSASIGDVSLSGASTTLDVGAVSSSGDLTLRVTCSDTRGYSTSVEKTVKVLPYAKPRFSMFNLRRRNEIEALVQLYFSGSVSSIIPDDVEKNSVVSIQLAWKSTSADDSSYQVIDLTDAAEMTITGLSFNYENAELMQLDEMSSFNFVFQVVDELGNASVFIYETILNQGTPLLSFRKKTNYLPPRVGINNPEPIHDLDVHGDIAMHDVLILGFVEDLDTQYISNATFRAGGYYIQSDPTKATTVKGYPVEGKAGMLEIIANPEGVAVQRYTTFNGSSAPAVYIRTYDGETWSAWKAIT